MRKKVSTYTLLYLAMRVLLSIAFVVGDDDGGVCEIIAASHSLVRYIFIFVFLLVGSNNDRMRHTSTPKYKRILRA